MTNRTCSFPDCERPHNSRGYCRAHADQLQRTGEVTEIRPVSALRGLTLEEKYEAQVIRKDGCWGWHGYQDIYGYSVFSHGRRTRYAHKVGWEMLHGPVPEKLELDHMCRLRSCVNPDHLRPITRKQNQEHRKGAQRNNKSTGVLGVTWNKQRSKYRARVRSMGKELYDREFNTLEEAEAAVVEARNRFFTHNDADRVKA